MRRWRLVIIVMAARPEMAYQALAKETEGKVDVWTYAWVPQNVGEFQQDFDLARRVTAKQILFWEADYIDDRAQAAEIKTIMSQHARWKSAAKI